MKNEILNALRNDGHKVELVEITKNNVNLTGFQFEIGDGVIRPVLYLENYTRTCNSVDEIIKAITKDIVNVPIPGFTVSEFVTSEYCKANIRIGFQRETSENIIKKSTEYDGIEQFLYVIVDANATFKVKADYLERVGISESDAWSIALENTCNDVIITNMADMFGIPGFFPMWVISNSSQLRGASSILAKDKIREFAKDNNITNLIVIPSSIHECILVSDELPLDMVTEMVKKTNAEMVEPCEQLSDKAYTFK